MTEQQKFKVGDMLQSRRNPEKIYIYVAYDPTFGFFIDTKVICLHKNGTVTYIRANSPSLVLLE